MQLPDEALQLAPREFYLLAVMQSRVDRWGDIRLTMDEMTTLTGSSRTTLWRDISALETAGFIQKNRTKRNLGKLHKNIYRMVLPCFTPETLSEEPEKIRFTTETSTAGQGSSNSHIVTTITTKSLVSNTSYYLEGDALEEEKNMNKWKDDDDNLGGFGLLEGELPAAQKGGPTVSKRFPKTRHLRPQEEWTPVDVATEFASKVYAKFNDIPGMVNTRALWGALAANRKKYNTTAVLELEVMEKFLGDERNLTALRKAPKSAHGMFLNAITNYVGQVSADLGMVDKPVKQKLTPSTEFVYASDGTEFDNSMSGRLELAEYEKSLN
jgi:uncharacterized membrane protein